MADGSIRVLRTTTSGSAVTAAAATVAILHWHVNALTFKLMDQSPGAGQRMRANSDDQT